MLDIFEDLQLHAEGGDGAGAAPGPAPGAEAPADNAPVAGENKPQGKRQVRKYGQSERLNYEYGLDPNDVNPAGQQNAGKPMSYEEFKKQFHDEIGKDIQAAVQGRFKNQQDNAAELANARTALDERDVLLAQLASQLGINPGADGKADLNAIRESVGRNRVQEYALENGVSEEYAEKAVAMSDKLDEQDRQLREYKMAEEARQKSEESYRLVQEHRRQAEEFRKKVPNFDLESEVRNNELFAHLIVNCGVGVENAYYAAHHEELMKIGQQAAAMQAQRALAESIKAGQSMPIEGGLGRAPAASPQRVVDFRNWTPAMQRDVDEQVKRGKKIYL